MIKADQVTSYDEASKHVERAAKILEGIDVSRLNAADRGMLANLIQAARNVRATLFSQAHERFVAERKGDVEPGA